MKARMLTDAHLLRVIDGDTILVDLTCPCCKVRSQQRIRLARIDAPELGGHDNAAAQLAKRHLSRILGFQPLQVAIVRQWPDKYGRVLAEVIACGQNVSNAMLNAGHAKLYAPATLLS